MRPDLVAPAGAVLAMLGATLQYLRAQRGVKEWWVVVIGAGGATLVWAAAVNWVGITDWQKWALEGALSLGTMISSLFGGTFLASRAADAVVKMGASPANPAVPVTDSKGRPDA